MQNQDEKVSSQSLKKIDNLYCETWPPRVPFKKKETKKKYISPSVNLRLPENRVSGKDIYDPNFWDSKENIDTWS